MKSTIKDIGPCKVQISLEIPQETVSAEIEKRYTELNQTVAFPGFRKGKTPRKLMEKRFGKDILHDAKAKLVSEAYEKVMEEKALSPVAAPDIDVKAIPFDPAAPFVFEFSIEVKPTFTLPDYTGVKVKRESAVVTDEDVEDGLKRLAAGRAELIVVEGEGAREEDVLIVDEEYSSDGKVFELQENATITISKKLRVFNEEIPALYDMLIGTKSGNVRTLNVKIPAEFGKAELRGKNATIKMVVREVKRVKVPDITDEWAKQLDFDSLADLRKTVRKRIGAEKEAEACRKMEEAILQDICGRTVIELPQGLVDSKTEEFQGQRRMLLYRQGMPEDAIEKEVEKSKEGSRESVVTFLKKAFIVEEIAKKEKIFVPEESVDQWIADIAAATKKWPNEVRAYYESNNLLPQLRAKLREEMVRMFLFKKAQVEPETPTAGG
jgi:trigger factor